MKYAPPLESNDPNASYTDPVEGTVPAAAVEQPMREIACVIHSVGLVPSETDLTQLDQAIDLKVAAAVSGLPPGAEACHEPRPDTLMLRDKAGRARAADPADRADIATRGYTDDALAQQDASLKIYAEQFRTPDFSLQEQWTGRRWIDGKKIYQKTVDCGPLPDAGFKYVNHGVEHIENVIRYEGFAITSGNTLHLPHVNPHNSVFNTYIGVYVEHHIMLGTITDMSHYTNAYVTIFYTCADR